MYHIILNPASQTGQGIRHWEETIQPYLLRHHVQYEIHFSKKSGDLKRLTKEICQKYPSEELRLIVVGGDGTINEVINGIDQTSRVILGYIPTGSSNDLARDLQIPSNEIQKSLEILFQTGTATPIDLGQVSFSDHSSKRFITSSGIGFDAAVCEAANRSPLKKILNRIGLGKLVYLLTALIEIFAAPACAGTLTLDPQTEKERVIPLKKLLFTTAMNHRYEGGGFPFCPEAKDDDGILDLCVVDALPRPLFALALPAALKGKHYRFHGVDGYHCQSYDLHLEQPLWVHTDGEVEKKADHLHVTLQAAQIRIIKP